MATPEFCSQEMRYGRNADEVYAALTDMEKGQEKTDWSNVEGVPGTREQTVTLNGMEAFYRDVNACVKVREVCEIPEYMKVWDKDMYYHHDYSICLLMELQEKWKQVLVILDKGH